MISKYAIPKDLFEFVRKNQKHINALNYSLGDFFRKRQPNPYAVLACLTDVGVAHRNDGYLTDSPASY